MVVRSVGIVIAMALVMILAGCNEDPVGGTTTEDFAAQRDKLKQALAKKKGPGKGPRAAQRQPDESELEIGYADTGNDYVYDSNDKRDPFRSFQFVDDGVPKPGFGPLGDFELGQLSVVAVLWDTSKPRALVADPGGRSFVVHEGSQIGKNNGRVIHIGDNLVLVKETYVDFEGNETTKDVELRIRRSQGG
jgi:hypothetical protein